MYYACLRVKKEQKAQNGAEQVIKKAFTDRDGARAYISQMQLAFPGKFDQAWTE
jgi:hypothetical protein